MKVLIISQHIFPIQTPRSNRTTELAKELARLGHEVTVYAVLGNYNYSDFTKKYAITIKNIPLRWQRKTYNSDGVKEKNLLDQIMGKLLGKIFEFPNIEFKYIIPLIFKNETKADLLISIADPHQIHWGCAKAKIKKPSVFPKNWIADCGDPFMANNTTKNHFKYFSKNEKLFCSLCNFITVPVNEAINAYYPEFKDKIHIIPQGFSFELPLIKTNTEPNNIPTFAYAGTFYKDIRNPTLFLDYLSKLKINFKFIIYTNFKELVIPYKKILKNKLEIKDTVERNQLIDELKKVDFLINLENVNSPNQAPSKLIDYSIISKPILSINTTSIDEKLINAFLSGDYTKQYIVKNIEQYHISNIANKFLSLINNQNTE
jgi:hypothetical protein